MDDILNDLFHNCALVAYVTIWRETGDFPPDSEQVRQLAYRLYEEERAKERAEQSGN
ncbi:hypothetical protein [Tautonia plasticadhaerens]|uniref:Uncharacterized protein n=1 Tax=Tautonia plasticadhaerens TaxID=2527974 RepID=A0A518H2A5_9BACT|nr:hypothetical protein [Tautonia plasticadhaerens]QDV34968.1 hypothetical protein ElP_28650 [Tautonia plasticadhaerens]